jgi:polar amino acid transport system permease protein
MSVKFMSLVQGEPVPTGRDLAVSSGSGSVGPPHQSDQTPRTAGARSVPYPSHRELAQQDLPKRKRRHPLQWILTLLVVLIAAFLIRSLATNSKIGWSSVGHYFFSDAILSGLLITLALSVAGQVLAIVLGVVLAAMRQSKHALPSRLAWLYINVFRGVPLIVQILVWFNLALAFPHLAIGIPFTSWHVQGSTNQIISPFLAGVLALGLAEAAYMAEIMRAGILAVPKGQIDAALSIGLTRRKTMRRIVLPQTLRVVIPPTGNQFIGLLKASALVSVIGGDDLLTRAQQIYSVNFEIVGLLIVASLWYLILTTVATIGQHYLERSLDRDQRGGDREPTSGASWKSRLVKNLSPGSLLSRVGPA